MEPDYKKIFEVNQKSNELEVCGIDICFLPINILRYFYNQCKL